MLAQPGASIGSLPDLRHTANAFLKAAGIEHPEQESRWLLSAALEVDVSALVLPERRLCSPRQLERAWTFLHRRAAREPLQYILGTQEFCGLDILVTPDVLIPRPESALLVEEALRCLADIPQPVVLDVGTGSGCLALAIAQACPRAAVYATDISWAALTVAGVNARRLGVPGIQFLQADLLAPFAPAGAVHVIVANPPYIAEHDLETLQPEVARYEPRLALAGGADGLAYYRRLLTQAPALLAEGGQLIVECGYGQAEAVQNIAAPIPGWAAFFCRQDAAGIDRVLVMQAGRGARVPR